MQVKLNTQLKDKAGHMMIGFTKSIALELGSRNICCNAIAPGFIETEMKQIKTKM